MIKKATISLINKNSNDLKSKMSIGDDFNAIFSVCIGKSLQFQYRFLDYVGEYKRWDTDVTKGILKIDDKSFNVEYIGTTSASDNTWFSSEIEKMIPKEYTNLISKARDILKSLDNNELSEEKIPLSETINGHYLSIIYSIFAPENVVWYCGNGNPSVYMFIKDLPKEFYSSITSTEFSRLVLDIISNYNVDHKIMAKALLTENNVSWSDVSNQLTAKFKDSSNIIIEFDDFGHIKKITGDHVNS